MSTRGCVAVGVPAKWEGVFNHWDSYPAGLGKEVWKILSGRDDLRSLCDEILSAGRWEAFLHRMDPMEDYVTSETPDPLFIEWVYIIDPERRMLHILHNQSVGKDDWSKPRLDPPQLLPGRIVDYGRFRYRHVLAAKVRIDGPEPDWSAITREKHGEEDDEE